MSGGCFSESQTKAAECFIWPTESSLNETKDKQPQVHLHKLSILAFLIKCKTCLEYTVESPCFLTVTAFYDETTTTVNSLQQ